MKKLLVFVALFVFGLASVSAMTESEFKAKLNGTTKEINGSTFKLTDQEKTLVERYLDQYEVTSADADLIVEKLEDVFDILKNSGKKKFQDLPADKKQEVKTIVTNLSASANSVDCTIKNGKLVVYVPNSNRGEIFYETPVLPIAPTNRSYLLAGLGLISVVGLALAFKKVKNA